MSDRQLFQCPVSGGAWPESEKRRRKIITMAITMIADVTQSLLRIVGRTAVQ
jgi:hypothetical protein